MSRRRGETAEEFSERAKQDRLEKRLADPERFRAYQRNRYARKKAEEPELLKAQRQRAYEKQTLHNLEGRRRSVREYMRRWRAANPGRARAIAQTHRDSGGNAARRARNRLLRETVLNTYGGACACCGERTYEFLCIDHLAGDGSAHRKAMGVKPGGGSGPIYLWLTKHGYPQGFQVLCHNCNAAKGFYGGCPHQRTAVG